MITVMLTPPLGVVVVVVVVVILLHHLLINRLKTRQNLVFLLLQYRLFKDRSLLQIRILKRLPVYFFFIFLIQARSLLMLTFIIPGPPLHHLLIKVLRTRQNLVFLLQNLLKD